MSIATIAVSAGSISRSRFIAASSALKSSSSMVVMVALYRFAHPDSLLPLWAAWMLPGG